MVKRNTTLTILVAVGALGAIFAVGFLLSGQNNLVVGNVVPLALTTNFRDFNCDAWNELAVDRNGVLTVVGSGRSGFNPTFDSSLLSLTAGGIPVDAFEFRLVILCDGNFIKYSAPEFGGATTISGSFNILMCGSGATGEVCFVGQERNFQQINRIATSTTTFTNVPLEQQGLQEDVMKRIWKGRTSADFLETLFPEGKIHLQTTMFPILTFDFLCLHPNCPTQGVFQATYNAITVNQPIIAQYGDITKVLPIVDTDGDGIQDFEDGCVNDPETFNGFQDLDGCPDTVPILDTDGDGIPDDIDQCVADPETFNGFQDENGCPDELPPDPQQVVEPPLDRDNDGVPDEFDVCPFEFGSLSNLGCPEPVIVTEDERIVSEGDQRLPVILPPELEPIFRVIVPPVISPEGELEITGTDIIILAIIATVIALVIIGILRRTGKLKV